MNLPPSDSECRWAQLVIQARRDVAPHVDVDPLLRQLHNELITSPETWTTELRTLLESRRWWVVCAAGTTAAAVLLSWQVAAWIEALSWLEWVHPAAGGAL